MYYRRINDDSKSIEFKEKSLELLFNLPQDDTVEKLPEHINNYSTYYYRLSTNLSTSYHQMHKYHEIISLQKKNLKSLKKLYLKQTELFSEEYIRLINILALAYIGIGKQQTYAIKLQQESYQICKERYKNNPEKWARVYIVTSNNLAVSYTNTKEYIKALTLNKEILMIVEPLYTRSKRSLDRTL